MSRECAVKLADFGVTAQLSSEKLAVTSYAGTPHFMAPEIIERQPYTSKVRSCATLARTACTDGPTRLGGES